MTQPTINVVRHDHTGQGFITYCDECRQPVGPCLMLVLHTVNKIAHLHPACVKKLANRLLNSVTP